MQNYYKLINFKLFIILIISLILSLLHSFNELIDDFAYSNLALVEIYRITGHIIIKPFNNASGFFVHNINDLSHRPLSSLLLLILEYISKLSAKYWVTIPFIGFYGFLMIYLIARTDLRIPILYAAIAAMLGVNVNANVVLGATFYYISIGYSIAFLTLRLLRKYFIEGDKKAMKIALFYCIIAPYFYYTTSYIINVMIFALITIYHIFCIIIPREINMKRTERIKIISFILIVGLMSFLNEKTPYTVLKEYGELSYFLESVRTVINILSKSFGKGGYVEYKPVFTHYGYVADILQKIFIISYFVLFIISLVYIIISARKKIIKYIYENVTLFMTFVATVAHVLIYLSVGEINLLMVLIFFAIIGVTAIRDLIAYTQRYKKSVSIYHVVLIMLLLLLFLSTTTGYTKQLIFAEDNIYGDFFAKSTNVVYFIDSFTDHSCTVNPLKVFMYHHTLAYITYIRVKNGISDCVYPEYILLDEFAPQRIVRYVMLGGVDIFYVHHVFAPYVRVGVKGVFKNFLIATAEELNISNKIEYIYNDKLNIIQVIRT